MYTKVIQPKGACLYIRLIWNFKSYKTSWFPQSLTGKKKQLCKNYSNINTWRDSVKAPIFYYNILGLDPSYNTSPLSGAAFPTATAAQAHRSAQNCSSTFFNLWVHNLTQPPELAEFWPLFVVKIWFWTSGHLNLERIQEHTHFCV